MWLGLLRLSFWDSWVATGPQKLACAGEFGGEDGFGEQGNVLGGDIRDTVSDIADSVCDFGQAW